MISKQNDIESSEIRVMPFKKKNKNKKENKKKEDERKSYLRIVSAMIVIVSTDSGAIVALSHTEVVFSLLLLSIHPRRIEAPRASSRRRLRMERQCGQDGLP